MQDPKYKEIKTKENKKNQEMFDVIAERLFRKMSKIFLSVD